MEILICNDDGIFSSGLLASKKAVESLGNVSVVGPNTQQSGIGRAITLFQPLRVEEVKLKDNSIAYSVFGTPTDALTIGIFKLMDKKPDLVISGINMGENIGGGEITTSGTVSVAMEAASFGIPAIAISMEVDNSSLKFHNGHLDLDYSIAEKVLFKYSKKILSEGLPENIDLININIPSKLDDDEIELTKLGGRAFKPFVETRLDPRGKPYYWVDGHPVEEHEEETDGYALKVKKRVSISPLKIDLTGNLDSLDKWLDK
ncbi:MAG: 5'/3'-nucleotidase SurE [Methanobrevibacter sp.]|jgi:5'-nucleotidase|nr:5'/3'-nucleotidase SurE [Methanobrevibacter sp.]